MTSLKITCPLCGRVVEPERFEEAPHEVKVYRWVPGGRGRLRLEPADEIEHELALEVVKAGVMQVARHYQP